MKVDKGSQELIEDVCNRGKKIYFKMVLEPYVKKLKREQIIMQYHFERPNVISEMFAISKPPKFTITKTCKYMAIGSHRFSDLDDFMKNCNSVADSLKNVAKKSKRYARYLKEMQDNDTYTANDKGGLR